MFPVATVYSFCDVYSLHSVLEKSTVYKTRGAINAWYYSSVVFSAGCLKCMACICNFHVYPGAILFAFLLQSL